MGIPEELIKIRLNKYLTQELFAKEINSSYTSVNRWENGKSKPNIKAIKAIVEYCKLNNIDSSKIEKYWND